MSFKKLHFWINLSTGACLFRLLLQSQTPRSRTTSAANKGSHHLRDIFCAISHLRDISIARYPICATFQMRDISIARYPICATSHLGDISTARYPICATSHLRDIPFARLFNCATSHLRDNPFARLFSSLFESLDELV